MKKKKGSKTELSVFLSYDELIFIKVKEELAPFLQTLMDCHCKVYFDIDSPYIKFNQSNSQLDFTLNGFDFAKEMTVISIETID